MSVVILRHLICDKCGKIIGKDHPERTPGEHRVVSKQNGWGTHSGKDLCPKCRPPVRKSIDPIAPDGTFNADLYDKMNPTI